MLLAPPRFTGTQDSNKIHLSFLHQLEVVPPEATFWQDHGLEQLALGYAAVGGCMGLGGGGAVSSFGLCTQTRPYSVISYRLEAAALLKKKFLLSVKHALLEASRNKL